MKKIVAFFTAAFMAISMTACAGKPAPAEEDTRPLGEMRGISSTELIAEMGAGWNLGNTFDAEGGETAWGNPVTTQEMIDEVYKAGFNIGINYADSSVDLRFEEPVRKSDKLMYDKKRKRLS